jgi:elongation factor 2
VDQTFSRSIESVNVVIATYKDDLLGEVQVYPERGTVGFGSGLHGWGFTIQKFAAMYASKFGVTRAKMMKRLWGDNFLSNDTKKWTHASTAKAGQKGDRGFCVFVLTPIETLFRSIMDGKVRHTHTDNALLPLLVAHVQCSVADSLVTRVAVWCLCIR